MWLAAMSPTMCEDAAVVVDGVGGIDGGVFAASPDPCGGKIVFLNRGDLRPGSMWSKRNRISSLSVKKFSAW